MEEHLRLLPQSDFESVQEQLIPSGAKVERIPTQRDVRQQNKDSMAALQAMLGGVQNAPGRKRK